MKLSKLRICDSCKSHLAPTGIFYVIRTSVAIVSTKAANEVTGLMQIFHGSLKLAEIFAPDAEVIKIASDEDKSLMTEIFICPDCFMSDINLAALVEARNE